MTVVSVDFVQVNGITCYAGYRADVGRELRDRDLGAQVAVVRCKLADHIVEEGSGHLDGAASFLDPGTTLHGVRGYRTSFRRRLAVLADLPRVARLVDLLLASRLGRTGACPDRDHLVVAFLLQDGTATSLTYDLASRRPDCRAALPRTFGAPIEAAL